MLSFTTQSCYSTSSLTTRISKFVYNDGFRDTELGDKICIFERKTKINHYAFMWVSLSSRFLDTEQHIDCISLMELFDNEVTDEELKIVEHQVLTMLDFQLYFKSPYDFLWLIRKLASENLDSEIYKRALFYLEVIQIGPEYREYPPAVLALVMWVLAKSTLEVSSQKRHQLSYLSKWMILSQSVFKFWKQFNKVR